MRKLLLFMLFIIVISASFTHSQENNSKAKFIVAVKVDCDNNNLANLFKSYLKRELREIQDVQDYGEVDYEIILKSDYVIEIHCMEILRKSGATGEIAVTHSYYKPILQLTTELSQTLMADATTKQDSTYIGNHLKKFIDKIFDNEYYFVRLNSYLGLWTVDDIKQLCNRIIANFDIEVLESQRKKKKIKR